MPKVEVGFVGCAVDVAEPNKEVVGAGWAAAADDVPNKPVEGAEAEVAVPNRPVDGAEVAVVLPNRPVDGADVVVVVPNEKEGTDGFAGPPPRLKSPPDEAVVEVVEFVFVFVLRLGKLKG